MHHLRLARALLPSFHEAACVEASVYRAQGRVAEAEALLRTTLRLTGGDAGDGGGVSIEAVGGGTTPSGGVDAASPTGRYFASKGLGALLEGERRAQEAWRAYMPALSLQPHDAPLALHVARLAATAREPHAADLLLAHVLRLRPADAAALGVEPPTSQQPPPAAADSSTAEAFTEQPRLPVHTRGSERNQQWRESDHAKQPFPSGAPTRHASHSRQSQPLRQQSRQQWAARLAQSRARAPAAEGGW